jgi:hypothetical protein
VPVTLKNILELSSMSKMKLIAGGKGLDRVVTRPLVGHIDYSSEVYGGELLFITGAGFRADEGTLKSLISESSFNNLAGIAFSVPNDFCPVIEQKVLDFADSLTFPLFQIPWDSILSEITKDMLGFIRGYENEDKTISTLMDTILSAREEEFDTVRTRMARMGFPGNCAYQAALVRLTKPQPAVPEDAKRKDYLHLFVRALVDSRYSGAITMSRLDEIVVFAPVAGGKSVLNELAAIQDAVITRFPGIHLHIGVGKPVAVTGLGRSLAEAEAALKRPVEQKTAASSPGMFGLFYDALDFEEMESFCDRNIGKLIDYDKLNGSSLVRTIEVYFENKFNLSRTAKELRIHRNSLMYRLRRIDEILGRKLDDPYVLLDVVNSVYIKKAMLQEPRATG